MNCGSRNKQNRLIMKDGLLYRNSKTPSGEKLSQLSYTSESLCEFLHDDVGKLGIERTTDLVRIKIYFPKMACEVEQCIKNFGSALLLKHLALKMCHWATDHWIWCSQERKKNYRSQCSSVAYLWLTKMSNLPMYKVKQVEGE